MLITNQMKSVNKYSMTQQQKARCHGQTESGIAILRACGPWAAGMLLDEWKDKWTMWKHQPIHKHNFYIASATNIWFQSCR